MDALVLDILSPKKTWKFITIQCLYLGAGILFFLSIVLWDDKKIMLLTALIILISGIAKAYIAEHKKIGSLLLDPDFFTIKNESSTLQYPIKEIEKIELTYRNYKGKPPSPLTRSIFLQKGINNFITLYQGINKYSFRIALEENQITSLNDTIKMWKSKNINVKLKNSWGRLINHIPF